MSEQKTEEKVDQLREVTEGVESEGLNVNAIAGMVIVSFLVIIFTVFAVVEIAEIKFQEVKTDATMVTGYPLLQQTRSEAEQLLSNFEVIDFENGTFRIPIDRAMELIVSEAEEEN